MKKLLALMASSLVLAAFVCAPSFAADDDKPKYTIKDAMKKAFKGPLVKKVAGGNASDDEKKELLAIVESMAMQKPKKGDEESWKKLTSALIKGAKAAVDGDADAPKMLKTAANCKACHSKHK